MRAKQFFYVCAGILLLAVSYHIGVESARADWDETLTGAIVGGDGWVFYTRAGEAWEVGPTNPPWGRQPNYDLPVPSSQVKLITLHQSTGIIRLITTSDDAWMCPPGGPWQHLGPFPGQPIQVESKGWSGVKERYRK